MKKIFLSGLIIFVLTFIFTACENDNPTIGSVLTTGEVEITIDTIDYQLYGQARKIENFDSKTGNLMIGNLQKEKYGSLSCSFVARLMCATSLEIADSIFNLEDLVERVDSCKLILGASRNEIVGDSLAPQVLTVYKLTQQLPSDINNTFNPIGYYDPSDPFATRSYTVSGIAESDSAFYSNSYVDISVDLPKEFGQEVFRLYKSNPEIFQWPQTMAKQFLPGIFVDQTFGKGCVANINSVFVAIYYYTLAETTTEDEDGKSVVTVKHVNNMAVPFTVSPEVLSSNNVSYIPSPVIVSQNEDSSDSGDVVITTPGGYIADFMFPAQDLIERYKEKNVHLSTVNDLNLYIPAEAFDGDSGIGIAQNLLMVKTSEYDSFFEENRIPDNKISFTGVYDSVNKRYYFSSMRNYFINLISKGYADEDDMNFTLVPIQIETETSSGYYGESTYVVKCVPYTAKPTMTLLHTDDAIVTFSFSTQLIK